MDAWWKKHHKRHETEKPAIETLVARILAVKQADPAAAVQHLETRIDHLVYSLYNLTPEEIATIESTTTGKMRKEEATKPQPDCTRHV